MQDTNWTMWGVIGGWILTGLAWGGSVIARATKSGSESAIASEKDRAHTEAIKDHEQRIRTLESQAKDIAAMKTDLHWIRKILEKMGGVHE